MNGRIRRVAVERVSTCPSCAGRCCVVLPERIPEHCRVDATMVLLLLLLLLPPPLLPLLLMKIRPHPTGLPAPPPLRRQRRHAHCPAVHGPRRECPHAREIQFRRRRRWRWRQWRWQRWWLRSAGGCRRSPATRVPPNAATHSGWYRPRHRRHGGQADPDAASSGRGDPDLGPVTTSASAASTGTTGTGTAQPTASDASTSSTLGRERIWVRDRTGSPARGLGARGAGVRFRRRVCHRLPLHPPLCLLLLEADSVEGMMGGGSRVAPVVP